MTSMITESQLFPCVLQLDDDNSINRDSKYLNKKLTLV